MSNTRTAYSTAKEVASFKKAAKRFSTKATSSQKVALRTLVDLGIYTPAGNLTSVYRYKRPAKKK